MLVIHLKETPFNKVGPSCLIFFLDTDGVEK